VEGFGKRSGIATYLHLPELSRRLPRRAETALFRIMQEALTNVHRHSGSRTVEVRVEVDDVRVVLTVRDFGNGFPSEVLDRFWKTGNVGVGLAGIRERLKELGGRLEIESNRGGTLLRATIPASAKEMQESEAVGAVIRPADLGEDASKQSSVRKAGIH
jgi:two-component system, NarL family, sensor kinase